MNFHQKLLVGAFILSWHLAIVDFGSAQEGFATLSTALPPANPTDAPDSELAAPGCPPAFQQLYRNHIKAWEKSNAVAIETSWNKVVDYGRRVGIGSLYLDE